MAYNFHELSPYVLIGNPLTLTVIEIFAVPGALLGTLLYPLGLDSWVWHYIGFGINGIMRAARMIGSCPGSTIHLPAFAPWSIVFLSLAVLSSVLRRRALLRATAIPLAAIGLIGAAAGPSFDLAVAPTGDAVAYRAADNKLAVIARSRNSFASEQWLRADADGRLASEALTKTRCDRLGWPPRGRADGRAYLRCRRFRRGLHPRGYYRDVAFRAIGLRRKHCDRSRKAEGNRRGDARLWK
jgi:competence protein ComEC